MPALAAAVSARTASIVTPGSLSPVNPTQAPSSPCWETNQLTAFCMATCGSAAGDGVAWAKVESGVTSRTPATMMIASKRLTIDDTEHSHHERQHQTARANRRL